MNLPHINFRYGNVILLVAIIALIIGSRFLMVAVSPWHDDAFNFIAKALNLSVNGVYENAHSTGYPLWIWMLSGWLSLIHSISGQWILLAANYLTVIFGLLLLATIWGLAFEMYSNAKVATIAAILVSLHPVIWRWSEVAMSDVPALALVCLHLYLFFLWRRKPTATIGILASLAIIAALLIRLQYGLLLIPEIVLLFWQRPHKGKVILTFVMGWIVVGLITAIIYTLAHGGSFNWFGSDYGSVFPSISEIWSTLGILATGIGWSFIFVGIVGCVYSWRQRNEVTIFSLVLLAVYSLYLSSWFRNGSFDIERYALLIYVFVIIAAASLIVSRSWLSRGAVVAVIAICIISLKLGQNISLPVYRTYISDGNPFISFNLKYAQLWQQKVVDGDLETYSRLARQLQTNDVVYYWQNDWIMPRLLIAGPHLKMKGQVVSVGSPEGLINQLLFDHSGRQFLLRGAADAFIQLQPRLALESQTLDLGDGYSVLFIPGK